MHSYDTEEVNMDTEEQPYNHETIVDLKKVTIAEFIMEHYKAGDGTPLITYAYTPVQGEIELLVPVLIVVRSPSLFRFSGFFASLTFDCESVEYLVKNKPVEI